MKAKEDVKTTNVIPIGTRVRFGDKEKYEGNITAITIKKYFVCYEVTFWKEHEQKVIGLYEEELEILGEIKREEIGFTA